MLKENQAAKASFAKVCKRIRKQVANGRASYAELARALEVSRQAVHHWIVSQRIVPMPETRRKIEDWIKTIEE